MSFFETYDFRAVERALTDKEQAELRAASSRATITARSFHNSYSYGSFRGNVDRWMDRHFDAYCHRWSSGGGELILRLPRASFPLKTITQYKTRSTLTIRSNSSHTFFTFCLEEGEAEWLEEDDRTLDALLPLREELQQGDLRALYLGWLAGAEDDAVEPPIPAGLGALSQAQRALVEFLQIGNSVVEAAAERSAPEPAPPDKRELVRLVEALGHAEQKRLLVEIASGSDDAVHGLRRRILEQRESAPTTSAGRTMGALLERAEELAELAEKKEAKAQRRQREAFLKSLSRRADEHWAAARAALKARAVTGRKEAIQRLRDLKELSELNGTQKEFQRRLAAIRGDHRRGSAADMLLDSAGLLT